MVLSVEQLRAVITGAVRVEQKTDGVHAYRFTREQEALYREKHPDLFHKTQATSGIALRFRTDSRTLSLSVTTVEQGSSRQYFAVDVMQNGRLIGSLDNFSDVTLPQSYTALPFLLGEFDKTFELDNGEKDITVYLPWSVETVLRQVALDDGASVSPVRPQNTLLCFGDSITQGYDALHPSHKYITQLAARLDAAEYNKAIGGEVFFPELASQKDALSPQYITVAYGTNDWSHCTREQFLANCSQFFENLHRCYPDAHVIVLTPIWRADYAKPTAFRDFGEASAIITETATRYANITVAEGVDLVDHRTDLFADGYLHPNDAGFAQYAGRLAERILPL